MIPTLTTDHLTLRAPEARDFDAYATFRESDRAKTVGGPYTREQAWTQFAVLIGHWTLCGFGRWIVAAKDTDVPLGVVGLLKPPHWPETELAWSMFENGEGKGFAFEAAKAARAFAYETLGLRTLISLVAASNTRSVALAKRLGATPEGAVEIPNFGPTPVWRHPGPEVAA